MDTCLGVQNHTLKKLAKSSMPDNILMLRKGPLTLLTRIFFNLPMFQC